MPVRKPVRRRSAVPWVVGGGVVVVAVVAFLLFRPRSAGDAADRQRFYTVDDGQTYFKEAASKTVPFEHGGREAVIAVVYRPSDGGKPFVGYLQKYVGSRSLGGTGMHRLGPDGGGVRVRKPRDPSAPWVAPSDPDFDVIRHVVGSDGQTDLEQVEPE